MSACRHRQSWLLAGGRLEWCYQCGALRRLDHVRENYMVPATPWCKPTGPDGANPFEAWTRRIETYVSRRRRSI